MSPERWQEIKDKADRILAALDRIDPATLKQIEDKIGVRLEASKKKVTNDHSDIVYPNIECI